MFTHDPLKALVVLRDHLATHDARIAFLFGAGTSSAINVAPAPEPGTKRDHVALIPAVSQMTEECEAAVKAEGDKFANAWSDVVKECKTKLKVQKRPVNIEDVLSRVRGKLDAMGPADKSLGLDLESLTTMERTICRKIATLACPNETSVPGTLPHHRFALWLKQANRRLAIEVFTTNYDVLIERALEQSRVLLFDGFVGSHEPCFYSECVEDDALLPSPAWIRLWKMHGSVNWSETVVGRGRRIVRGPVSTEGHMILPSDRKYDESRKQPYRALLDRLASVISSDPALLVTCGYSFGDQHINSVLFGALDNHPLSHIVALVYDPIEDASPLVDAARSRPNLLVYGPNAGVIGGRLGEWRLREPISTKNHEFADLAFDSDAEPDVNKVGLSGRMRLGDFNWFCEALLTMGVHEAEQP